jgi:hypothetical protein
METTISPGTPVIARDAFGRLNRRIATTPVKLGLDFPVVWICTAEEWALALAEDREPEGIPFPAEDVTTAAVDA